MNMQKKIIYVVFFLIVLVLLPYGIYKYYFKYQDGLYPSLKEYDKYQTTDKKYTVMVMDTNKFGDEEILKLKVYLIDNDTDSITYISTVNYSLYGKHEITYSDNHDQKYEVTVYFSTADGAKKVVVDCENKKNAENPLPF